MDFFLQLLFTGVGIGAVYALVALGFVLIFRATNVVNFAQGEFSMVAAYLMVVFAVDLGWPYWLAFAIAIAGMALLGAIFNLLVYYPLRNRSYLPVLISTIGASIFLANSVLALYGPQPQVLPGWFDTPGAASASVCSAGAAGNSREKTAPFPGSLVTLTSPPCSRTMPSTIASPRPVPTPAGLVVKNGSKIREAIAGGMPGPSSLTSNCARRPESMHFVLSRMVPPLPRCSMACRALPTRFMSTCCNRPASPSTNGRA